MHDQFTRIRQTMLAANLCFASTEELAFHMRYAGKPAFVLPNGFSQHIHDLSRHSRAQLASRPGWAHSHRLRRRLEDATNAILVSRSKR